MGAAYGGQVGSGIHRTGFQCAVHVPHLNDFNTDLVERRKGRTVEALDRLRMAELEAEFNRDATEEPENEDEQEMEA